MTHPSGNEKAEDAEVLPSSPQTAVLQAVSIEFRGSLPHPQLLAQYDEIVPNGAERLVNLAEQQVHHRQSMEARGQIFTFLLAVVALLGGIALSIVGDSPTGLVPLVAAIAGLGGLFVYRGMHARKRT